MSDWDGPFWRYEKTVRRRVEGGIKAKSQRGDIGETWWSKRFITVLESYVEFEARLARGRSYARSGQVLRLDVHPGVATALVQGSRPRPYEVRIGVTPLSERDWRRAEEAMARQAIFMAKLLAGEMPRDIEEAFAACKLSLFPRSAGDMDTDCTCPDWARPCKHAAATLYILAERFDEDPFLIFAWRGRTRGQLVERLRALRGTAEAARQKGRRRASGAAHRDVPPLASSLATFWQAGPELSALAFSPRAAEVPDAILRQLGPPPPEIGGAALVERLAALYRAMTVEAERRAFGNGPASRAPRQARSVRRGERK